MSESVRLDTLEHPSYQRELRPLIHEGTFREPIPAYLRAIAAEPDTDKQVTETTLYALELCGVLFRRSELEGDARLLKSDVADLRDGEFLRAVDAVGAAEQSAAEALRIHTVLEVLEQRAEANVAMVEKIVSAQRFDALHTQEQRAEISELVAYLKLDNAPCFEEIRAMERVGFDQARILAPTTTSAARRVLEMLVLHDIEDLQQLAPRPSLASEAA